MRILHVSTKKVHPCFSDAISLQAARHDVIFILLVPSDAPGYKILSAYNENGLKYMHLSAGKDFDLASDPGLGAAFSRVLKACRPDVVHIQFFSGVNALSILRACAQSPAKKVLTLHTHGLFCLSGACFDEGRVCLPDTLEKCSCEGCRVAARASGMSLSRYNLVREKRLREAVSLADKVICCSRWQRDAIGRLTGMEKKAVVLYYGVTIDRERHYREKVTRAEIEAGGIDWKSIVKKVTRHGWGELEDADTLRLIENGRKERALRRKVFGSDFEKFLAVITRPKKARRKTAFPAFGYLGTMWDLKGIDILLEAVQRLGRFDFQVLMGVKSDPKDPDDAAWLEKLKEYPQVRTMTNLNREDLFERFFSQIDYAVIPSRWEETGPMTLFESFYYKVPVIISGRPSLVEKTTVGVNSLVFDDAESLARIMKDIIEGRVRPAARTRRNFPVATAKAYAAGLEKIYSGKQGQKQGPGP